MSATLTRAAGWRKARTGGLAGWTRPARIVHDDQGAYFEINLD
jgi:hypothetical protein